VFLVDWSFFLLVFFLLFFFALSSPYEDRNFLSRFLKKQTIVP